MAANQKKASQKPGDTGIPGCPPSRVKGMADKHDLYVLFEANPVLIGGRVRWAVYDRTTGKQLGTYYPATRSLAVSGRDGFVKVHRWPAALLQLRPNKGEVAE